MIKKIFTIIFYIIGGFFIYSAELLAFFSTQMYFLKLLLFGLAAVTIVIALFISGFNNWIRTIGIVLLSSSCLTIFIVFTLACYLLTPEFRELLPRNGLDLNYSSGITFIVIITVIGLIMIKKGNRGMNKDI